MITISTPTFDLDGSVALKLAASSDLGTVGRRVARIATLDGGAVLPDYGYSDADRTFKIVAKVDAVTYQAVKRLVELYPQLVVACREGVFLGAIKDLKPKKDEITITYLVKEAL